MELVQIVKEFFDWLGVRPLTFLMLLAAGFLLVFFFESYPEEFRLFALLGSLAPTALVQATSSGDNLTRLPKVLCAALLNALIVITAYGLSHHHAGS